METLKEEMARFAKVMRARKQPEDLLTLFAQLSVSGKFSAGAKPACFALLTQECLSRLPRQYHGRMQVQMESLGVGHLLAQCTDKAANDARRALVVDLLTQAGRNALDCQAVFDWLKAYGWCSRAQALGYALEVLPFDEVDEICEITQVVCDARNVRALHEASKVTESAMRQAVAA